jgi:outer membrane protein TolC
VAPAAPEPQHDVAVLDLDALVAEVVAINPDIRAASAAWRAAAQRYPQEVSLDDPMFGYLLGPGSWGSDEVESAYMLEASQKLPWPGKRQMRGNIARAEANAAYYDVGEQRLRIAEAARLAYFDYYLAHRQIATSRPPLSSRTCCWRTWSWRSCDDAIWSSLVASKWPERGSTRSCSTHRTRRWRRRRRSYP